MNEPPPALEYQPHSTSQPPHVVAVAALGALASLATGALLCGFLLYVFDSWKLALVSRGGYGVPLTPAQAVVVSMVVVGVPLLLVVPAFVYCRRRGRWALFVGVIIGMALAAYPLGFCVSSVMKSSA
jgi:hypothetical protein